MRRVVGARHPQCFESTHAVPTNLDVLQGVIERVAQMQSARDVGWRDNNGERLPVATHLGLETAGRLHCS